MDNEKIIQIIPAPANMLLRYAEDDGTMSHVPPLCLALVQYGEGQREIRFVDTDTYGIVDFADSAANFDGVDWKEATP